jgi:hypothetical protein
MLARPRRSKSKDLGRQAWNMASFQETTDQIKYILKPRYIESEAEGMDQRALCVVLSGQSASSADVNEKE